LNRFLESRNGSRGVTLRDVAMPSLLEEPRIARMESLQTPERCQRLGDSLRVSLTDGQHIQQIAVGGCLG
jgi:hypothetical protein